VYPHIEVLCYYGDGSVGMTAFDMEAANRFGAPASALALQRAREAVRSTGKSAVINIWVDPKEYALGTRNQTMYK
jgi:hypothetical protein